MILQLTLSSKRDGLEKAVFRIEQAIKKSRTQSSQSEEDRNTFHLQNLLSEAQGLLPPNSTSQAESSRTEHPAQQSHANGHVQETSLDGSTEDQFAVDDAENPLQLLARASDLSAPTAQTSYSANAVSLHRQSRASSDHELQSFFGPFRPSLDVGPDTDPIDLGLVTEDEATALFAK
jgi:hypothetical protein